MIYTKNEHRDLNLIGEVRGRTSEGHDTAALLRLREGAFKLDV